MADFALLECSKLISRKTYVIEKSWNFHTVYAGLPTITIPMTAFVSAAKKKEIKWGGDKNERF